jgi:hypothetical protein
MKLNNFYKTIVDLNSKVKSNLKKSGFIVPIKLNTGGIKIGNCVVQKNYTGFFEVINTSNDTCISNINLPQTAILLANASALGKLIDDNVLNLDKNYGYALFDEEVHLKAKANCIKSKDYIKFDIMIDKIVKARYKKELLKKEIDIRFRKLLSFR